MRKETKFLSLAVFSLIIFIVILLQVVNNGPMVNFDRLVNMSLIPVHGFVWKISLLIHYTFGTLGFGLILFILFCLFLFKKKHSHSLFVIGSLILTIGLTYLAKMEVGRIRPTNFLETDFSFPSGHAIYSFMIVALLFYLFAYNLKNVYLKRLWASAGVLVILMVAFSRLYLQVHWFSDILGSWALGLMIFGIMAYLHEKFKFLDKKHIAF